MRRRYLLLGILALASATGCANRPLRSGHCCIGSMFPGRAHLARPMSAPIGAAPIGYGAPAGFDGGVGAPGCSSCAGGTGMPIASTGGYPHGFRRSNPTGSDRDGASGRRLDDNAYGRRGRK